MEFLFFFEWLFKVEYGLLESFDALVLRVGILIWIWDTFVEGKGEKLLFCGLFKRICFFCLLFRVKFDCL